MEHEQQIYTRLFQKRPIQNRLMWFIVGAGIAPALIWFGCQTAVNLSATHASGKTRDAYATRDMRETLVSRGILDDTGEVLEDFISVAVASLAFCIVSFSLTMIFEGDRTIVGIMISLAALTGIITCAMLLGGSGDRLPVYGVSLAVFVAIGAATGRVVANR